MKKILIFGSNHHDTSVFYKKLGVGKSILVNDTKQNYEIGHTAIQEFNSKLELETCLSTATEVYWAFPQPTEFLNIEIFYETVEWLKQYHFKYNNVKNFHEICFDPYKWSINVPEMSIDDAVFLGCSFTEGTGLSNSETHYASIVSKHFNKNCINLAKRGLNNQTSFELLTQINFKPNQIVIWQITYLERIRYIDENKKIEDLIFSCTPKDLLLKLTEVYNKNFLLYELKSKIKAVVNLAREKKIRLLFWLVDYKNEDLYSKEDQIYFYNYPEFVPAYLIQNYIVDHAEDKLHPGVQSNKLIANAIIQHLETIYST